jgi:hypothetical protein
MIRKILKTRLVKITKKQHYCGKIKKILSSSVKYNDNFLNWKVVSNFYVLSIPHDYDYSFLLHFRVFVHFYEITES